MDKIRDLRGTGWFRIDNLFVDLYAFHLGVYACIVYISLCMYANKNTQTCWPCKDTIAGQFNISERSVYEGLKKLAEFNIIKIEQQARNAKGHLGSNVYTLIDKSCWKPIPKIDEQGHSRRHNTPKAQYALGTIEHSPQANDGTHHRHHVPRNNNNNNKNKYNNTYIVEQSIFDHWNSKRIMIHKTIKPFMPSLKAATKTYGASALEKAINNYASILSDDSRYFFNYRWTLKQFLTQTNAIDRFTPENFKEKNFIRKEAGRKDISGYAISGTKTGGSKYGAIVETIIT